MYTKINRSYAITHQGKEFKIEAEKGNEKRDFTIVGIHNFFSCLTDLEKDGYKVNTYVWE